MKPERVYAAKESLRYWCWILELIGVLGASAVFSFGLKQTPWIAAGLALLLLSFLLRWGVVGHISRATPFDAPWVLLLVGAIGGLCVSYDVGLSMPVWLALLASVSLYYVVVNAPQTRTLAQIVVLVGLVVGAYYLTQYQYTGSQDKSAVASSVGNALSSPFPRLGSWSPSSNGMASLLEGLVPVGVALAVTGRSQAWRIVGGMAVVVMGLALLVTASRGAWIALAVGFVLWLASRRREGFIASVVAICVTVAAVGGYLALGKDVTLQQVPAIGPALYALFARPDRLAVYRGSLRLIQDFALTGIGVGEVFALVYSRYVLLIQVPFLTYSHNLYLTVWLGHGLLGVMAIGWLLVALGLLVIREEKKGRSSALFQAAWIGTTIILVHGLFDARQYVDLWTMWPLFVLPALVTHNRSRTMAESPVEIGAPTGWRKLVLGLPLLLAVAGMLLWRPVGAMAYANAGAVHQAKAELSTSLAPEARDAGLESAEGSYSRALQLDPRNRTASLRLGNLAVDNYRYEEGVAYLERVWQVSPRDPTARKALGLAYVWVGQTQRGAELLSESPNIVAELNAWGWWHEEQGHRLSAMRAYQTSLLLYPDQPELRGFLATWQSQ